MLLRTECKVKLANKKSENLYEPMENTHDIFPPCYLPLYRFVSLLQCPFLHLKNLHWRGVYKVYYFAELLHRLGGKVFDDKPLEFRSSNLVESGKEDTESDKFEWNGPVVWSL